MSRRRTESRFLERQVQRSRCVRTPGHPSPGCGVAGLTSGARTRQEVSPMMPGPCVLLRGQGLILLLMESHGRRGSLGTGSEIHSFSNKKLRDLYY